MLTDLYHERKKNIRKEVYKLTNRIDFKRKGIVRNSNNRLYTQFGIYINNIRLC